MVQGKTKLAPRAPKSKTQHTKRAAKASKPQKLKTAGEKMSKKFAGALTAQTEKMLGQKAGHLELIGKGKKDRDASKGNARGGTKKFG